MARRGSGFGTVIKIAKAIDKAGRQSARAAERRRKQQERDYLRQQREREKLARQEERELSRQQRERERQVRQEKSDKQRQAKQKEKEHRLREKGRIAAEKEMLRKELENAKVDFESRCSARQALRYKFINAAIR
ncbi:hypothetical protein ACJJIQ_09595 [Microbulbifer sp. ANSA003]|uniref:hypothetical protein n=1 Tax=Microbulbifer sp. ANSA003 TaxID=3243360 RepID=UPI0040422B8A